MRPLKIQVAYPVDNIEQQERGGKEDTRVCIEFQNVYMHTALSPRSIFAVFIAAEETLAVFSIQALINTGIIKLLPVHGVVERDNCGRRTHIQY